MSDLRAMIPDITIITPVCNAVDSIAQCIRSVATQGVAVQHIVMDGGSTDGTVDIIREHEKSLAHWETSPDCGQSHAINKGLAMAQGRIVNWLNADDALEHWALQEVIRLMREDVYVVAGNCAKVGPKGKVDSLGKTSIFPSTEKTITRYGMAQPSHFYRTEVVQEIGGLNEHLHFAMDMDLWFRFLLKKGVGNVRVTEALLSRFSMQENAKSQLQPEEMNAEHWGIMRSLFQSVKLPKALQQHLDEFSIPEGVGFVLPDSLDRRMLLTHLCEGMLPNVYAESEGKLLGELLGVVADAGLLTATERLLWQLRLLKMRVGK